MRQAWMPISLIVFAVLVIAGCDGANWNTAFSQPGSDKPAARRVTSEPIQTATNAESAAGVPVDYSKEPPSALTRERPAGSDGTVAPLAAQVQSFVGRFPADNAAGPAAGPPTQKPDISTTAAPVAASNGAATPVMPPTGIVEPSPAVAASPPKAEPPPVAPANPPATAAAQPPLATTAMAPADLKPPALSEFMASPEPMRLPAPSPGLPADLRIELTDVRPAANAAVGATTRPAANPANQPVQKTTPAPATGITALIDELEQSVTMHPQQLDDQFKLRLLYSATGQHDKAAGPIAGADPVQADLLTAVFRMIAAARQSIHDPATAAPVALATVDELRRLISRQSPVIIPKIALVTRVNSFGDYDAVSPPRFPAGQPVHVFLYTEVSNFRSEPDDNRLRTLLAEKVEIFDAAGACVWQRSEPTIEDRALSPRRDFFMTMEVQLPADTPPGDYVLKVTVEDKLGASTDQQRMTFTIAAR